uniref:B30.2/SPRY domain-containing protein n=2 Tax=Rhizophagus irregularis TaxID=588596 RepID=U9UFS2_RHIID
MEIVLEYIYTGSVKEESLTKDNIIETFYVADYFQLLNLQDFIMKTFKNILKKNYTENYSPELLSKFVERMPLMENRIYSVFLNLLVEAVANIPLNTIEFGRLSISGLQHLLSHTHEKKKIFATPEYEVFRYSTILVAKQVSYEAFKTFLKRLPTLDQLENSIQVENKFITDHQKVVKELEPLIKFIDFRRIKGQILVDIIEPLEIVQAKIILDVYRYYTKSNNSNLNDIRGIPKIEYVWDETACGSKLIIEDNGKVVYAPNGLNSWRSVRAKNKLEYEGIYEWDFIIKNLCFAAVGVCASENLNYEAYPGYQFAGWIIDYNGCCYSFGNCIHNYCPRFGDGAKITVHLDANEKTCAFTVNGTKTPKLSACNNLTSKFYPLVSLYNSGRIQIQSHSKEIEIF